MRDYRQEGRDAGQRLFECEPERLRWEQVLAFCEGVKEQAEDCLRDRASEAFVREEDEEG